MKKQTIENIKDICLGVGGLLAVLIVGFLILSEIIDYLPRNDGCATQPMHISYITIGILFFVAFAVILSLILTIKNLCWSKNK